MFPILSKSDCGGASVVAPLALLIRPHSFLLHPSQPPDEDKKRDERNCEEERPAAVMDCAVDHLRSEMDAQQPDHQNSETVSQNPERNDKRDQDRAAPGGAQKEIGCDQAGDEKNPARTDATAFLSDPNGDVGQLKDGPLTQKWRAGETEEKTGRLGGSEFGGCFKSIGHCIRHWNQKEEKRDRERALRHPFATEEQKTTGDQQAEKRQSHEPEIIILAQGL